MKARRLDTAIIIFVALSFVAILAVLMGLAFYEGMLTLNVFVPTLFGAAVLFAFVYLLTPERDDAK